jgi:hypothetical protein
VSVNMFNVEILVKKSLQNIVYTRDVNMIHILHCL